MAKALTPRQREIKDLIDAQPGITAVQLADVMETSTSAMHQQLSRLRKAGAIPKARNGRRASTASKRNEAVLRTMLEEDAPTTNGEVSLEDHLDRELGDAIARISEIEQQRDSLDAEQAKLAQRRDKLAKAQEALTANS